MTPAEAEDAAGGDLASESAASSTSTRATSSTAASRHSDHHRRAPQRAAGPSSPYAPARRSLASSASHDRLHGTLIKCKSLAPGELLWRARGSSQEVTFPIPREDNASSKRFLGLDHAQTSAAVRARRRLTHHGIGHRSAPVLAISAIRDLHERVPLDERGHQLRPMHRWRFTYGRTLTVLHDTEKARVMGTRHRPGTFVFVQPPPTVGSSPKGSRPSSPGIPGTPRENERGEHVREEEEEEDGEQQEEETPPPRLVPSWSTDVSTTSTANPSRRASSEQQQADPPGVPPLVAGAVRAAVRRALSPERFLPADNAVHSEGPAAARSAEHQADGSFSSAEALSHVSPLPTRPAARSHAPAVTPPTAPLGMGSGGACGNGDGGDADGDAGRLGATLSASVSDGDLARSVMKGLHLPKSLSAKLLGGSGSPAVAGVGMAAAKAGGSATIAMRSSAPAMASSSLLPEGYETYTSRWAAARMHMNELGLMRSPHPFSPAHA